MSDDANAFELDHVLVAVDDLGAIEERLWRDYGLACQKGGRHLEMGTANLLVPLGSAYL